MGEIGARCCARIRLRQSGHEDNCQPLADIKGAGAALRGNEVKYRFDSNLPPVLAWLATSNARPHPPLLGGTE